MNTSRILKQPPNPTPRPQHTTIKVSCITYLIWSSRQPKSRQRNCLTPLRNNGERVPQSRQLQGVPAGNRQNRNKPRQTLGKTRDRLSPTGAAAPTTNSA